MKSSKEKTMRWMLCLFSFVGFAPCFLAASDDITFKRLKEVPTDDWVRFKALSLEPDDLIRECSDLLAKKRVKEEDLRTLYKLRGNAFAQKRNMSAAASDFEELCRRSPSDCEAHGSLAVCYLSLKRPDEALGFARKGLALRPNDLKAHCIVAAALLEKRSSEEAVSLLNKAIALDETFALGYYLRGLAHYQRYDPTALLKDMNRFIELEPVAMNFVKPEKPFYYRGFALILIGRPTDALKNFVLGRTINPESVDCLWGAWRVNADLGRWHIAAGIAEEYKRRRPNDAHPLVCCADSYVGLGEVEKSLELARTIEALSPADPRNLTRIGEINSKAGRYREALTYFDRAIQLEARMFEPVVAKSFLLSSCPDPKIRDGKLALVLAEQAHHICNVFEWKLWETNMALAMAHAELGSFDKAMTFATKAIDLTHRQAGHRNEYERRRELFRRGLPYRSAPVTTGVGTGAKRSE